MRVSVSASTAWTTRVRRERGFRGGCSASWGRQAAYHAVTRQALAGGWHESSGRTRFELPCSSTRPAVSTPGATSYARENPLRRAGGQRAKLFPQPAGWSGSLRGEADLSWADLLDNQKAGSGIALCLAGPDVRGDVK
jgi:hypothetical protein